MSVRFRNVEVPVDAPVEQWPYEALIAAIERGTISDWARLTRQIREDPWGPVARQVELYLSYAQPWGVGPLLERALSSARTDAQADERAAIAADVRALVEQSGLSPTEFASRIGTSRSRLSTYRNGRVTPSAALLLRMRRLVERRAAAAAGQGSPVERMTR